MDNETLKISKPMAENPLLSAVPVDTLIDYCINNLSHYQRQKIAKGKKNGRTNLDKAIRAYLYSIDGELIEKFNSISDVSRYLKCGKSTILCAYRRKRIFYGVYWVSKSDVFDMPEGLLPYSR